MTYTEDKISHTTVTFNSMNHNVTTSQERLSSSYLQLTTQNVSVPDGCIEVRFDQMEYLPWDNPDNIVSLEVEETTRRIKDVILLPLLFLIGAPANVINMAVFYKQGLKERINLCLFALSLSDELYLIEAMFLYGERLPQQFTSEEGYGPLTIFMTNHNLVGFFSLTWTYQVLSAIIASERCLCVMRPLKFQTIMKTKTTAVIIIAAFLLVIGPYFLVASRYRLACVYDPLSAVRFYTLVAGEFYKTHEKLITYLDSFVYGAGIPMLTMIVVTTATTMTAVKLRQIVAWRAETSSSLSAREVGLTRMLIGSSVLFIVCVSPIALFRFVWLFMPDINSGRRHQNFFQTSLWVLDVISFINSSFNIFVYYTMGSRYRETFWALPNRR